MSKSSSLSVFPVKNNNKKNNIKIINDNKSRNKNTLPNINNNIKSIEGSKINNEGGVPVGDNLEKINDMMKQMIEQS